MGGAIFNHQGELVIENSTLSGNSAIGGTATGGLAGQGLGGAIFNLNGQASLDSATVAANSAGTGGALYNLGYLARRPRRSAWPRVHRDDDSLQLDPCRLRERA